MVQLNGPEGKAGGFEKILRWGVLIALGYGAVKLFNAIAPDVIELMKNIYWLIGLGVPLAFIVLFVISNPGFIWMAYKGIIRKIVSGFIKMDPLSIMKGYLEYIQKKKENLDRIVITLDGRRVKLERKIKELEAEVRRNKDLGRAALKGQDNKSAQLYGTYVSGDEESIKTYLPLYTQIQTNVSFLRELSDNWDFSIKALAHQIERKEEEYLTLKETVRALRQAKDFAQASEVKRLYEESVKALELNVSQKLAYIQDFEIKSKDAMRQINIEKGVRAEQGMLALQNLKDENLFLPTDFSVLDKLPSKTIAYETIPNNKKFGLLDQ
jgi:hypothetical protein